MPGLEGASLDVLSATEFVAIVTNGENGPHTVGTWGDYIRRMGVGGDSLVMPAGRYRQTEENLKRDARVTLLAASRQVQGSRSPGQGCEIAGLGEIVTEGPLATSVKAEFPWARGALVVRVTNCKLHL